MSEKINLLFPGQGSQYKEMNLLWDSDIYYSRASEVMGLDLKAIVEKDEEQLKQTQYTQPALLTQSFAAWKSLEKIFENLELTIGTTLGHSVGEYSALLVNGVFSFEDAISSVFARGQYMQEAVPIGEGSMYAILKANKDIVDQLCQEASNNEFQVMAANYNSPEQIVISGHTQACQNFCRLLKENPHYKMRAIELKVSAPFHSHLMMPAQKQLESFLQKIPFQTNQYTYMANIDSHIYGPGTDPQTLQKNLVKQVTGSVLWEQSFQKLESGDLCLEVGPGKVLKGLAKKINPQVEVLSMDDYPSLEDLELAITNSLKKAKE